MKDIHHILPSYHPDHQNLMKTSTRIHPKESTTPDEPDGGSGNRIRATILSLTTVAPLDYHRHHRHHDHPPETPEYRKFNAKTIEKGQKMALQDDQQANSWSNLNKG